MDLASFLNFENLAQRGVAQMCQIEYLFLSDLHLEADQGQHCYVEILEKLNPKRIVINGDFHGGPIHPSNQWLLDWLRQTRKQNRKRVIHIRGNHDLGRRSILGGKTVRIHKDVTAGKKWHALHGHTFDWYAELWKKRWIDKAFDFILWLLKKERRCIGPWLDTWHKKCHGDSKACAIAYATEHHLDLIFTGHTHLPEHSPWGNIEYVNLGDWDWYATIDQYGRVELHHISSNTI